MLIHLSFSGFNDSVSHLYVGCRRTKWKTRSRAVDFIYIDTFLFVNIVTGIKSEIICLHMKFSDITYIIFPHLIRLY